MAADLTPAYSRTGYYAGAENESFDTLPQEGALIVDLFAMTAFKSIYPTRAAKATVEDPVDYNSLATECYVAAQAMIDARNAYLAPPEA